MPDRFYDYYDDVTQIVCVDVTDKEIEILVVLGLVRVIGGNDFLYTGVENDFHGVYKEFKGLLNWR